MSIWSRTANIFRANRMHREIDEELESHIEEAIERGRDPAEARRALGSVLHHRESSRDIRLLGWLDSLRADAVFGWRQLMKRKVTSAAAIVSLGLAIGACTSAFRLIDALLLRPLPVAHPERLYVLARQGVDPGGHFRISESFEYPLFRVLRAAAKNQAELIAVSYAERTELTYGSDRDSERAWRQFVSGWMFDAFGLKPAAGRLFTEQDDVSPGADPYCVLSYDYWTRRFARDPHAVGRTFRMGAGVYAIIGVAPAGFTGTEPGVGIDVFFPTMMNPYVVRSDASWFRTFIQLTPGIRPERVRERLFPPYQAMQEEWAKGLRDMPRSRVDAFLHQKLLLEPASSGNSDMQREYGSALAALGVLVVLVFMVACANVANLMTAQAAARAREMALRVSIGAGRKRLMQLVLMESILLGMLAALIGGLFAWWSAPFIAARINPPSNPARLFLAPDWRVLAFGAALTLAATCLFGLAPALRASTVKPAITLKGGEDPHSRRRLMHGLIAVQVAFCVVVLFVAGLFVTTFERLSHRPPGFSTEGLRTVDTVARRPQLAVAWDQAAEHLRATPGVERVALAGWPLLGGNGWNGFVLVNGVPVNDVLSYFLAVSPGWFETMKIPLVDGRDFRAGDTFPGVAIVNEAFARTYFNGQNPIGKWFEKQQDSVRLRLQIVGLAGDTQYRNLREPVPPIAFVPFSQTNAKGAPRAQSTATFLVRTASASPLALASMLRQEVPRAGSEFRVYNIQTQQELVEQQTVRERLLAMLALFFAAAALLLAGVGLYAVLDHSVLQRRKEIGIRMAVGARPGHIVAGVAKGVLLMVLLGTVAGFGLGLASARYITTLLYEVKPTDAASLGAPALMILAAALLAALPAVVRAVRIDPVAMLRSE